MSAARDENDLLLAGELPADPAEECEPFDAKPTSTSRRWPVNANQDASGGQEFSRGDHVELAEVLLQRLGDRDDLVFTEGRTHRYEATGGLWRPVPPDEESRVVQGFAGSPLLGDRDSRGLKIGVQDVNGARRLAHDQIADPDFFAAAASGLAFADGFLEVSAAGIALRPHDPRFRARHAFDFGYACAAPTPLFDQFLGEIFATDPDRTERKALLGEFFGAALLGLAPRYQRCIVLVGRGNDGKSTLLSIIERCFPPGAVCAIPPQDWGHEYKRALLAGKRLNVVSELPEREILATDAFKAIITGDTMTARQIREAPFTVAPIAGHAFATNTLPGVADTSEGFWRRFVVLPFSQSFAGREDRFIADRIVKAERAGLVKWMVESAQRLLSRGSYELPESSRREVDRWRLASNPIASFLAECTRPLGPSEPGEAAASLYSRYRAWCERSGHHPVSNTKFGMRMGDLGTKFVKTERGKVYLVRYVADGVLTGSFGNPSVNTSGVSHA